MEILTIGQEHAGTGKAGPSQGDLQANLDRHGWRLNLHRQALNYP